jgi:hypothetical protein
MGEVEWVGVLTICRMIGGAVREGCIGGYSAVFGGASITVEVGSGKETVGGQVLFSFPLQPHRVKTMIMISRGTEL